MVILAAGILIGATAMTIFISAGTIALAQVRLPFQTHPPVQAPLQRVAKASPSVVRLPITIQYTVNKGDISSAVFVAMAADCPLGSNVTGGGYYKISSSKTDFKIVEDRPGKCCPLERPDPMPSIHVSQWQVMGYSPDNKPEPPGTSLEVYAVCLS